MIPLPGSAPAGPPLAVGRGSGADAAAGHAPARGGAGPFELRAVAVPTCGRGDGEAPRLGDGQKAVAARWSGVPGRSELVTLVLMATTGEAAGLAVALPGPADGGRGGQGANVVSRRVIGHHVKEVMRSLLPLGIDVTGLEMDTAVAAYLLDASTGEYELSICASRRAS